MPGFEAKEGNADINGFNASVTTGVEFEFYIANPVSIDLSIRYNAGLTDVFACHYGMGLISQLMAETAPLTYTAAYGQHVKALSDYDIKSRLGPLSLHVGVNIRFLNQGAMSEDTNGAGDTLKNLNDTLNDTLKLSDSQRKVVDLIKKNNTITHLAISNALGVTEITAKRITKSLKEAGILKRAGSRKSGHWEIIELIKK